MRHFIDLLGRFRRDESGAFAIIFALIAIVLVAMSGAVVDFTSVQQARTKAQVALDSAALALQPSIYTANNGTIQSEAQALLKNRLIDPDANWTWPICASGPGAVVPCVTVNSPVTDTTAGTLEDLRGVRGEMIMLRAPDIHLTRPVRLLHPRFGVYVIPRGQGVFMLGGTLLESSSHGPVTVRSAMDLLNAAYALHPAFAEAQILELGVGVRPAFPDNLPRVFRRGNVIHVNGLYRHGFLLSPAMAQQAAQMALANTPEANACISS